MAFQVLGQDKDAIATFEELLGQLHDMDLDVNPFRDPQYLVVVLVEQVSAGNVLWRVKTMGILGRPRVTVRLVLSDSGTTVDDQTFSSSIYLVDERDAGFVGGYRSYLRTNCRKLTARIVDALNLSIGLPYGDRDKLLHVVRKGRGELSMLKWIFITALGCGGGGAIASYLIAPEKDKLNATGFGFLLGALVGMPVGLVFGRIAGLIGKLLTRWFVL